MIENDVDRGRASRQHTSALLSTRPGGIPAMNKTAHQHRSLGLRPTAPAVAVACGAAVFSPTATAQTALESVIVTAQKRDQDIQSVPITVNVLGNKQLTELGVKGLEGYVEMLPNVSFIRYTPATAEIYIRGVSGGGNSELGGASRRGTSLRER